MGVASVIILLYKLGCQPANFANKLINVNLTALAM